jgi:hypothetical protein
MNSLTIRVQTVIVDSLGDNGRSEQVADFSDGLAYAVQLRQTEQQG